MNTRSKDKNPESSSKNPPPNNEKSKGKKVNNTRPNSKNPDDKPSDEKRTKKTGGRKGAASKAGPDAFSKKLQEIARLENSTATAYADNTTPRRPPPKTTKGGNKGIAPRPRAKGKGKVVVSDTSDGELIVEGSETEVDGSVKKKGNTRADRSYRNAILDMRKKLDLGPIGEDDEATILEKKVQDTSVVEDIAKEGHRTGQKERGDIDEARGEGKSQEIAEKSAVGNERHSMPLNHSLPSPQTDYFSRH